MNMKKTIKIIKAMDWCEKGKKINPYDVKTKGKYPVHMIESGSYITEEEFNNGTGDMGWFYLNKKDYDIFKANLKDVEVEYCE